MRTAHVIGVQSRSEWRGSIIPARGKMYMTHQAIFAPGISGRSLRHEKVGCNFGI
jgi:hypothetical protein